MGDLPPDWAIERACEIASSEHDIYSPSQVKKYQLGSFLSFARYIAEHEEPPVDPALVAARALFAEQHRAGRYDLFNSAGVLCKHGGAEQEILSGEFDRHGSLLLMLSGIHRGIELAKSEPTT